MSKRKISPLEAKAIRLARKIPSGRKTKAKCAAVHAWVASIKEMLAA